jgi:acyl carrier protein
VNTNTEGLRRERKELERRIGEITLALQRKKKEIKNAFAKEAKKDPTLMKIFETIRKIISKNLEVEESRIQISSSLRDDVGFDSLDTYELVYAFEEEYGIAIPDEVANAWDTIYDVVKYIHGKVKRAALPAGTRT